MRFWSYFRWSIFLQKTWNTFTLSNIYIFMRNNTFAAGFFLKTWNFHCTRRSKIENFKYCKSSISWKLEKWSQSARTCSDCSYVPPDHASVCHTHVETSQSLLSEFTYPLHPVPPPPLKYGSSEICCKSHFSKWIFLLILRVAWAVNGTKMQFKISSIFLPHSLARFLDFSRWFFSLEHSEFLKKYGSSKIWSKSHFSKSIFL